MADNKKIIVIDDDEDQRILIKKILERKNYQVIEAEDTEEGTEKINTEPPDLILLDMNFGSGKKNGLTFLRLQSKLSTGIKIPVIALSVISKEKIINYALALGAADYLIKPLVPKTLIQKVDKFINTSTNSVFFDDSEEEGMITIQVPGVMTKIQETACVVRSPLNLLPYSDMEIDSLFLKSMGVRSCPAKVIYSSKFSNTKQFDTIIKLTGVNKIISRRIHDDD